MKLPEKEHMPELEGLPDDFAMLVFGPPKVGKTSFGANAPNSVLIECEPDGAKYVKGRVLEVNSQAELREAWTLIKDNPKYCDTVVIDTLDRVAQWVEEDICKSLGITNILGSAKGEKHGAQWGLYAEKMLAFVAAWRALKKRVIFLAHTKKAEMDGNGLVINPKTINLYGATAHRVVSIVENIGHMYATQDNQGNMIRVMSFTPGQNVEAGSRHPVLNNKVITLDQENPYASFLALFAKTEKKNKTNGKIKEVVA